MIDLYSQEFMEQMSNIGFTNIGIGWYQNEANNIRIRVWNNEIDLWEWKTHIDMDENQIRFRGNIKSIDDIKWLLDRCFGIDK